MTGKKDVYYFFIFEVTLLIFSCTFFSSFETPSHSIVHGTTKTTGGLIFSSQMTLGSEGDGDVNR